MGDLLPSFWTIGAKAQPALNPTLGSSSSIRAGTLSLTRIDRARRRYLCIVRLGAFMCPLPMHDKAFLHQCFFFCGGGDPREARLSSLFDAPATPPPAFASRVVSTTFPRSLHFFFFHNYYYYCCCCHHGEHDGASPFQQQRRSARGLLLHRRRRRPLLPPPPPLLPRAGRGRGRLRRERCVFFGFFFLERRGTTALKAEARPPP